MQAVAQWIDRINAWIGRVVAWLTLGMVLVTFLIVVLRYAFATGSIALQESVTWMHAAVFMLGAAYALGREGHVRVDIFYRGFSPRSRAWVNLLGTLFFLWPMFGFVLWSAWGYVAASWAVHEASPEAGGLPGVFLLKTVILVMAVQMLSQGLVTVANAIGVLRGGEGRFPPADAEVEV